MRLVALLAVAACGDNLELDPSVARSGSRLRLVHYDYGDGARETDTQWFHDAVRDERCTPRQWSDGVTICTPAFTETVFPTSDCTRPLGRVPTGAALPPYFVRPYFLSGTWFPSRIYLPGEPAAPPTLSWQLRDGACLGPYDVAGYDYFELGRELERAGFARITHPEVTTVSRLALEVVASEDGLYAPTSVRDRDLDAGCAPAAAPGAASTPCIPEDIATAEYYYDAQCSVPELAVSFGDRIPQVMRHHDARSGCTSYHAVGVEVDAPPLFHRNGASCVAIAAPVSNAYFLAGAPRELASLERVRASSTGRMRSIDLVHGEVRIADTLLHDTVLATECRRGDIGGVTRCLPETSIRVIERFGDDACQAIVALAEVATGACAPPAAFARTPAGGLHAIGAVHGAALYHLSTGDRCLPYAIPEGIALHDVGPVMAAEAFAEATIVVDP